MTELFLDEEASLCRQRAHAYVGRPQASLLLTMAREFDRLHQERHAIKATQDMRSANVAFR